MSPSLRGVAMVMPERALNGSDQYNRPVSGSRELADSGCQMISWRWPPASQIIGELYPGSLAVNARHSSLPVSLSKATAVLPSPAARQINLLPSSNGWPAKPHIGVLAAKSFLKSCDQATLPLAASKQNKLPSAPRE